jgi:molybdopterin-containing oxidoreductase family membrane subunit
MATDTLPYRPSARGFWLLAASGALLALIGILAAHAMEVSGHAITGMNNQIVWGLPHVFAVFLVVAASGVLNVANIYSVFGENAYRTCAPLSGLLCIALVTGGVTVEVLDLGRPERVVVAMTHHNFSSVFAWNAFLYTGMIVIVAAYLGTIMDRRHAASSGAAGVASFVWRIVLTTGTGSIFAFLVARAAYGSALLAPLFIVLSLSWGLAVFLPTQAALHAWNRSALAPEILRRMRRLLGLFVAAGLFLTLVLHLTSAYFARQVDFERFLVLDGAPYPLLFWLGYVGAGCLVPMLLAFHPRFDSARALIAGSLLVVLGAFAWLYVFIIGGQAWPLDIFPGYAASSSFADGAIGRYAPSPPELLLGLGGAGIAFMITVIGARVLPFLPQDDTAPLADTGAVAK